MGGGIRPWPMAPDPGRHIVCPHVGAADALGRQILRGRPTSAHVGPRRPTSATASQLDVKQPVVIRDVTIDLTACDARRPGI